MGKGFITIGLLIVSNVMMTFAWYGHLKFGVPKVFSGWGVFGVIVFSWLLAFFEYCAMVPANRIGFIENGGPFSLMQLKIIQEAMTLLVFTLITTFVFKTGKLNVNHIYAFLCLIAAVYFVFKK